MNANLRTYSFLAAMMWLLTACSTQKNTAGTRRYHAITARFNAMYNGQKAFDEGVDAQERGHKDNYTELLPMFVVADKNTASIGKSNFETAITKAEKAIKKHSIKRKPKRPQGKMSAKQRAFYNRREFNPFLKKAWMTLADAQFRQGEFIDAASAYNYIIRLYADDSDVNCVARAKLARCYVMLEWPYDAEDVFSKISRDSITTKGKRERDASYAAYLIYNQQYKEALPYVANTAKHTRGKQQRARLYFLTGQLHRLAGNNKEAYKALRKCIKLNPTYELAFNARILQTEVMAKGQGKAMIRRLQRMTKDPGNADYLDQIYYAMGNIHLADADTLHAIYAWKKGIEESKQNGFAKAMLCQRLGELHWQRNNYIDARECYDMLVGLMDKQNVKYGEVSQRAKALDEIEPHLSAVKLQDSLQVLAKLPEKEYLAAIDRVIAELKQKEKEQAKKEAQNQAAGRTNPTAAAQGATARATGPARAGANRGNQQGAFYFYNPQMVMQGKQEFQRRWGNRENEDNWRRSNKTVINPDNTEGYDYAAEDSLANAGLGEMGTAGDDGLTDEERALKDSLANDPHHREYYLKQIPFTEEQVEASNQLILDGLYHGGVIMMEKIENFSLAKKTLFRIVTDFQDFEKMDDVYYHLFLLAMREENAEDTAYYRQMLQASFPESKLTVTVSNPRYMEIAYHGTHLEDSLYAATYEAYKSERYDVVDENFGISTTDFPEGAHRGKFLFVHAMSQLYTGHRETFLAEMKELVSSFSKDEISEMAGLIVKGVQEGRLLASDKWDNSSIWARRSVIDSSDSTAVADSLVADPLQPYVFILAYPTGQVDEDQLLFEMARWNFTSFMARNFDIEIVPAGEITQMRIKGFQTYDEVHAYAQQLYADATMRLRLEGIRGILISEDNLKLLGTRYSYDDYKDFYDEQLRPLQLPEGLILDETNDGFTIDADDLPAEGSESEQGNENGDEEEEEDDDDDWLF